MRKSILIIFILLTGSLVGYSVFNIQNPDFRNLSPEEMYQRIIKERDYAINQAVAKGDFRCCITPPCTMCYMEANQWNSFTAGTCACDNLITQGKEPCPQCKKGLCGGGSSTCNHETTNTQ
jgi:hypothetical protein